MTGELNQNNFDCGSSPDERPSEAVIEKVADLTDQSPLEMEPLAETIDTDALNALFDPADASASHVAVTFEYSGCQITMTSDDVRAELLHE